MISEEGTVSPISTSASMLQSEKLANHRLLTKILCRRIPLKFTLEAAPIYISYMGLLRRSRLSPLSKSKVSSNL